MIPQGAEAAERLAIGLPTPGTILRAATLRARMKDWSAAEDLLIRGLQQFPASPGLLQARAELPQTSPSQNADEGRNVARGLVSTSRAGESEARIRE